MQGFDGKTVRQDRKGSHWVHMELFASIIWSIPICTIRWYTIVVIEARLKLSSHQIVF